MSGFTPVAGLAETYSLLEVYADAPNAENRARGMRAAERAVELDPSLPEAHSALAMVRQAFEWNWQESEQEFRTAIRLSPSYATAHHWLAPLLATLGRLDEALEEITIARELDPRSSNVVVSEGYIRRLQHDYARSIEVLRAAVAMKPDNVAARVDLAISLTLAGDHASALRVLREVEGAPPETDSLAAGIRARAGDTESARRFLRAAEARPDAAREGCGIAGVHLVLGDRAGALRWLHAAADERSWVLASSVAVEPVWDELHGDPEFERLLRRLGLQRSGPNHSTSR